MKKYYAAALIVIVVLVGFACQCPAKNVLDNPAVDESNTAVIIDAIERMGVLAIDTVKDVSPHVWKMARSKVMADVVGGLLMGGFFMLMTIASIVTLKKSIVYAKEDDYDNPLPIIFIVTSAFVIVIGAVVMPCETVIAVKKLVAIDYHTLMSITQLLH